jgi:hypothetical protein
MQRHLSVRFTFAFFFYINALVNHLAFPVKRYVATALQYLYVQVTQSRTVPVFLVKKLGLIRNKID